MTAKYTVERTGERHSRRIVRDGQIIGFALATLNGGWLPADANGKVLNRFAMSSPTRVRQWFEARDKDETGA